MMNSCIDKFRADRDAAFARTKKRVLQLVAQEKSASEMAKILCEEGLVTNNGEVPTSAYVYKLAYRLGHQVKTEF